MRFFDYSVHFIYSLYRILDKRLNINKPIPIAIPSKEEVQRRIGQDILSGKPILVGRFGANEIQLVATYLLFKEPSLLKKIKMVLQGAFPMYTRQRKYEMLVIAGFFPTSNENLYQYSKKLIKDSLEIDYLASIGSMSNSKGSEKQFIKYTDIKIPVFPYTWLYTWGMSEISYSWTEALKNKKVLIVSPFEKTIKKQHAKRKFLFDNPNILPEFDLITFKSVQTHANQHLTCGFKSWFEAFDFMKSKIEKIDFDIALLGCGSYGMPLATHIKRLGKQAIYLGGPLQLLFGIKGNRWNKGNIGNESWVRPLPEEIPTQKELVEKGAYW